MSYWECFTIVYRELLDDAIDGSILSVLRVLFSFAFSFWYYLVAIWLLVVHREFLYTAFLKLFLLVFLALFPSAFPMAIRVYLMFLRVKRKLLWLAYWVTFSLCLRICPSSILLGYFHKYGKLPHRVLYKLSTVCGPIVLLKLDLVTLVVVSTAEKAEIFLKTYDTFFASRPTMHARNMLFRGSKGISCAKYGQYWRCMRKLCDMHLLSVSKVDSFMPMRRVKMLDFVNDLRAGEGDQVVNISAKIKLVIEEITYDMIFGAGNRQVSELKPFISEAIILAAYVSVSNLAILSINPNYQPFTERVTYLSNSIDELLENAISENERCPVSYRRHGGLVDVMLSVMTSDSVEDEENLNKTDIKAIILDMLFTALDKMTVTIEWVIAELLRHPSVMKQVQEELVRVVGLDRMVEEADLDKLLYLNMVVKETMRLYPAAPLLFPHESTDYVSIQGYHIPKGSTIIINAWAIGRDEKVWSEDAEDFRPERFARSDIDVRGNDLQLIPFGSGRRKCPGIDMGLRTVYLVIAQLVHCFNLELPHGMEPMDMEDMFEVTMPRASLLHAIPSYRLHM